MLTGSVVVPFLSDTDSIYNAGLSGISAAEKTDVETVCRGSNIQTHSFAFLSTKIIQQEEISDSCSHNKSVLRKLRDQ